MRTSVLTLSYHIIFMERLCIISLSFSPHLGKIDITKKKKPYVSVLRYWPRTIPIVFRIELAAHYTRRAVPENSNGSRFPRPGRPRDDRENPNRGARTCIRIPMSPRSGIAVSTVRKPIGSAGLRPP